MQSYKLFLLVTLIPCISTYELLPIGPPVKPCKDCPSLLSPVCSGGPNYGLSFLNKCQFDCAAKQFKQFSSEELEIDCYNYCGRCHLGPYHPSQDKFYPVPRHVFGMIPETAQPI